MGKKGAQGTAEPLFLPPHTARRWAPRAELRGAPLVLHSAHLPPRPLPAAGRRGAVENPPPDTPKRGWVVLETPKAPFNLVPHQLQGEPSRKGAQLPGEGEGEAPRTRHLLTQAAGGQRTAPGKGSPSATPCPRLLKLPHPHSPPRLEGKSRVRREAGQTGEGEMPSEEQGRQPLAPEKLDCASGPAGRASPGVSALILEAGSLWSRA